MTDPSARTQELLKQLTFQWGRLRLAQVLKRIRDRAARGRELERWPLPQPEPVDADSSLAADDAGFLPDLGGDYVRLTALYPAMSATDCLGAIGQLVGSWEDSRNAYLPSLLVLCRSAMETAAKTIWLLCDDSRDVRRKRAVGLTWSEMSNQKSFHAIEKRMYSGLPDKDQDPNYRDLQEHIRLFLNREQILTPVSKETPPNDTRIVINAAKWIDRHLPPDHGEELADDGLTLGAERIYVVSSALIHGYKWVGDYVKVPQNAYALAADGLAASIAMADCAVALYEAQAQRRGSPTSRARRYPERIEPTLNAWSTMYGSQ